MQNIFKDGVLVDVNVCFWSGAKALTPDDLGLDPSKVADAFKLGKKFLVPEKVVAAFRTIEGRARRVVEKNSFRFPIGNAYFVPRKKFASVLSQLREHQAKYVALVEDLVENYDTYRQEMTPVYREAAETAFLTMQPEGVQTFNIDDREADKANYVSQFLARIEKFYPTAASLRNRYSLDWSLYEVAMPKMSRGEGDQIAEDEETREAMGKEYREQFTKKVSTFFDDVVKTLRGETMELCNRIVSNIKDGKVVKGRTLDSLRNFIDKFGEMNFVGDVKVEEQLETLRKEFLNTHTTEEISEQGDLQEELKRRLGVVMDTASDVSDINSITGEYQRKVSWQDEPEIDERTQLQAEINELEKMIQDIPKDNVIELSGLESRKQGLEAELAEKYPEAKAA